MLSLNSQYDRVACGISPNLPRIYEAAIGGILHALAVLGRNAYSEHRFLYPELLDLRMVPEVH